MWATMVQRCLGGLLESVRRVVDEPPGPCRARRGRLGRTSEQARSDAGPEAAQREPTASAAGADPSRTTPAGPPPLDAESLLHRVPLEIEGELPPGPWQWRWVWPTPGRPAGMALVASDGTLVLWSAGGFAPPGAPPDGRPSHDVAAALARIPDLSRAAVEADSLRAELERARVVADETRRLLGRAAGTVEDEIGRVNRPGRSDPTHP